MVKQQRCADKEHADEAGAEILRGAGVLGERALDCEHAVGGGGGRERRGQGELRVLLKSALRPQDRVRDGAVQS